MSAVGREIRAFREAIRFFTRIPLPSAPQFPREIRWAMTYFPLVGWFVGAAAAIAFGVAAKIWPTGIASGMSLLTTVLLTGAFHEDGLADVCDGFGGGRDRERVLAIMKDSRIGAFGALGLGLVVLLKWQSIANGAALNRDGICGVMGVLWCGHALSRGMVCAVPKMIDYLDSAGSKSKPMVESLSQRRFAVAAIFAAAPALICGGFGVFSFGRLGSAFGVMALGTLSLTAGFSKRLGGYTGDCLGAIQQITELMFYLVMFAAWP